MKFNRFTHTALGLLTVGSVAWGCSSKSDDCKANLNCGAYGGGAGGSGGAATGGTSAAHGGAGMGGASGASGSSGTSGTSGTSAGEAGSAGAPDAGCDTTLGPEESCTISNQYGLFVSKDGDDTAGDGTMEKPFATLTKALDAASAGNVSRLYLCGASELAEPGTVTIPDHVSIYGGFKTCTASDWTYDTTGKTKAVLKPASPIGAKIAQATSVVLQDLRIDAADAPEDGSGASSFGMIVSESSGVVLTHVEIHAGTGGAGKAGMDGAKGADGTASGATQNGGTASCAVGAPSPLSGAQPVAPTCGSKGGTGGSGITGVTYQGPEDGFAGTPSTNLDPSPNANGGKGATMVGASRAGGSGTIGAGGLPGTKGAAAGPLGVFSATGYVPADGGSGTAGFPGQGGGGGGASLGGAACVGASGGAGGMGGCGGDPGAGGTGGGASIALLSWNSMVTLEGCTLVAAAGGAAGRGGNAHGGGAGKTGGTGGAGDSVDGIGKGGNGGDGGPGGNGGNGAGGSGGPSIALVWSVMRPSDLGANTLTKGAGGALGVGGKVGGSSALLPGFDGQPGKSLTEYQLP